MVIEGNNYNNAQTSFQFDGPTQWWNCVFARIELSIVKVGDEGSVLSNLFICTIDIWCMPQLWGTFLKINFNIKGHLLWPLYSTAWGWKGDSICVFRGDSECFLFFCLNQRSKIFNVFTYFQLQGEDSLGGNRASELWIWVRATMKQGRGQYVLCPLSGCPLVASASVSAGLWGRCNLERMHTISNSRECCF